MKKLSVRDILNGYQFNSVIHSKEKTLSVKQKKKSSKKRVLNRFEKFDTYNFRGKKQTQTIEIKK